MKLSLVIPCYNDHENVAHQLDQLTTKLDFHDFEVIVVDDASLKPGLDLLYSYQGVFGDRLRIFRNENNKGPGPTRNEGIEQARGEYICFVDSDDLLEDGFFFYFEEIVRDHQFDLAVFKYHFQDQPDAPFSFAMSPVDEQLWDRFAMEKRMDAPDCLWRSPYMIMLVNYPWNKIYRRSLLIDNHIRFPALTLHEDVPFHWICMMMANQLYFAVDYPPLYIHNRVPGRDRATDKSDATRVQLIDSAEMTLAFIGRHHHLRMYYPIFLRFFLDVLGWATSVATPTTKSMLEERSAALLKSVYSGELLDYLRATDKPLFERIQNYFGAEVTL
jgi:glycosyltransferase involved in cell wall biosynthesis